MKTDAILVKVNLPESEEAYGAGNGEGCWAFLDDEAREAYERDSEGGGYRAVLDNDSVYYPGLAHGTAVPVEMRGERRPVVPYAWLSERYGYDAAAKRRVVAFLAGESEVVCPSCGRRCEPHGSDEGPEARQKP